MWRCEDCHYTPELKAARGNCGGPFTEALQDRYTPNETLDEQGNPTIEGAYVQDGLVYLSSDSACGPLKGGVFTSCPVAATSEPWVAEAIESWRCFEKGQLSLMHPEPSAGLMNAIASVGRAMAEVDIWERADKK